MGLFNFGESYDTAHEEQRAANYEQQTQQAKVMRREGRTNVTPNPTNPVSLKGTMTTPKAPATPTPPPATQTAPAPTTSPTEGPTPTGSPFVFSQLLDAMRSKLSVDDNLTKQKNLIFTQLYDRPLTDEEKSALTPDIQRALESNDRQLIDMEVRLINDQIKGRTNTLDNAIKFYVDGYNATLADLDSKRKEAQAVIDRNIELYGSRAFKNVPESYKRQIEQTAGYGEGYLDNLPETLSELNLKSQIANRGGSGSSSDIGEIVLDASGNPYIELSEKGIRQVDLTTEAKKLKTLADLKVSAQRYKDLVEDYGYEAMGTGKSLLESAYADYKIKWKEAANLGALTGPDVSLIIETAKPITGVSGLKTKLFGGGVSGLAKTIQTSIDNINTDANRQYDLLTKRRSEYQFSPYVQALGEPFKDKSGAAPASGVTSSGVKYTIEP